MKQFLAIYVGTPTAFEKWQQLNEDERKAREAAGIDAWTSWSVKHAGIIADQGGPLGKTKRISPEGVADIKNVMAGYVVVKAESHEAAAKLFENHAHFTHFPGDSVEIMEVLPMPNAR